MKRGFEENVPKVRPRVRLGQALDEQVAEAQQVAAEESIAAAPITGVAPAREPLPPPPTPIAAAIPVPVPTVAREIAPEPAPARRVPRRAPGPSVTEVTDLARELTADLTRAAETNARLKSDLDAALAALRLAAEESSEQRADSARLAADLDKRGAELRALRADIELLEAERDGALAQVARLSRELREEKARVAASAEEAQASRAEVGRAREALQRLTAELHVRVGERDEARKDLLAARSERERLSEELLAAHADVDAGMGSEQLFGEAFALGPRGEQVLARYVAFTDADMELRGEALERFARAADLCARGLGFLGGRGHPGFLLAQLAGEPGDLRARAVPRSGEHTSELQSHLNLV